MVLSRDQFDEVQEARLQKTMTRRATVPDLEEILYTCLPVLDHGFLRVIDYMGDDAAIVQAARVSYGKGTKKINQDKGLIDYLMRHQHTTPFEMCEIKYHIKLPIFIARQWIRHRTANVNEYSGRYSILDREFYVPRPEDLAAQSSTNHQGRSEPLSAEEAENILRLLREDSERCYDHYQEMLNKNEQGEILDPERSGLTRELARLNLTLNYYTQWYWKIDLHNLFHFLALRADAHAQYEIRAYAEVMLSTVEKWVPLAYDAFVRYRQKSVRLSQKAWAVIGNKLQGKTITQEQSGLGVREWQELQDLLKASLKEHGL